jgi:hypothetical protein
LELLTEDQWDQVEYDIALPGLDAHVVGVAVKGSGMGDVAKRTRKTDVESLASKAAKSKKKF